MTQQDQSLANLRKVYEEWARDELDGPILVLEALGDFLAAWNRRYVPGEGDGAALADIAAAGPSDCAAGVTPSQSEWEQRLTAQTCSFAHHIDREGEGWSKFRHSDVCAALGEVERLRRSERPRIELWRNDALTKSAEIVRRWFGADGEGCAQDIEAMLSVHGAATNEEGDVYTAEHLMALLKSRDDFLVSKGLFGEYADSLPSKAALPPSTPPAIAAETEGQSDLDVSEINAEVVHFIREAAKRVTGGNCTFVDEDIEILEHLAIRAVEAGLTDGLHPSVAAKALTAALARSKAPKQPASEGGEG